MDATWKRQAAVTYAYKFDYIDVNEFHTTSIIARIRYCVPFFMAMKSIFVYMADITSMALTFAWLADSDCTTNTSLAGSYCERQKARSNDIIPFKVRPWIMLVSVGLSFLLLFLDWRKAWVIIKSRDIAHTFTSNIASRYYSLKSYPHFCFFLKVKNSRNLEEKLTFFVFFVFKGWKRLILAELPRQALNFLFIFDLVDIQTHLKSNTAIAADQFGTTLGNIIGAYVAVVKANTSNNVSLIQLILQTTTVFIWCLSFSGMIVAFLIYIPLLGKIRGNLKEFCCVKIDKRYLTFIIYFVPYD
ncbi:hypothetical protein HK096_003615 [Nowakowskiella sp. JEL0078]|nr:hypothetical protein HK096_003615 [Nowakowskiella sp. JEL0078]